MSTLQATVNDQQLNITLRNLQERMQPGPLLRIAGQRMRSSEVQTFREQGVPSGSWAPLAKRTLRRGKGGAGRKTLIQSGRLMSSVTDDSKYVISGNTLRIGSNLVYARIQQLGGMAGRGLKTRIPARPYLVFRPEDPEKIKAAMERYIASGTAQQ